MGKRRDPGRLVLLASLTLLVPTTAQGQGLILPGAGATHRAMAGASTAAGVDALGALYWNPAAIRSLPGSEVVIGGEAIIGDTHLGSTIPAGTFGGLPLTTLSGYTRSDSGVGLASGLGVVYRPDDSPITYGLGLVTLAGGSVNFPGNPSNPILAPVGPFNRFVLGPQAGSITLVSLMPSVAYQVTDRLVVGAGPMVDVSVVSFDPAFFGPPDDSNGDGLFTFPTGSHSRPFWGGGFRAGATYRITDTLTAGVSFISPQWFETWRFNARTEVGDPITFRTRFTLPTILSAGVSFCGIEGLVVSADVRWFDYRTTQLLGQPGSAGGADWDSIWAAAVGARYQLTERLAVHLGYLYNQNPIPDDRTILNTLLPGLIQHTVSAGTYFQLNDSIGLSAAYVHGFKNSISGGVFPLVGTSTTLDTEYDSFVFGLHIKFGSCCAREGRECEGLSGEGPAETAALPTQPAARISYSTRP
ncbi:MAG: outer membrane protein transport protein [Gemmataceae bacterium]|nr:outer membrane protein transport protein [Gemmataceae bacterium]